ncbi:IS1 family transposase, partial [Escherichia coli]|uniref:IS1 family transposase n=1 Tax=Escherichia coli TaxID=562 RepID=UPI002167F2B8
MSGKPAARQGDMTQYGGSIVQGSAGVRIGAPTGVACSVCPGGVTSGHPVNPLLGAKVLPGETDIALRCPSCSATDGVVRNGKSTAGHQRYLCSHCRKTWQLQFTYTASQPGTHQKIIDMAMN